MNWCFRTVVLEKTLESPLDCKESIQPVHPKGNQSWIITGRTDAEAEIPILWSPEFNLSIPIHFSSPISKMLMLTLAIFCFGSVLSLSHVQLFVTPWTIGLRPPCSSPTPGVYSNSCPLSQWCHPSISSSAVLFSSCPQSFPASGSFPMSQFFTSGGQSIGVSTSASVLPMNIQDWFPLGWTGWISLLSKGLSRVFLNTTVQTSQFFSAQLSL